MGARLALPAIPAEGHTAAASSLVTTPHAALFAAPGRPVVTRQLGTAGMPSAAGSRPEAQGQAPGGAGSSQGAGKSRSTAGAAPASQANAFEGLDLKAARLLLSQKLTTAERHELKADLHHFYNHGTDDARRTLQAQWGERLGVDHFDDDTIKLLLFASSNVKADKASNEGSQAPVDDQAAAPPSPAAQPEHRIVVRSPGQPDKPAASTALPGEQPYPLVGAGPAAVAHRPLTKVNPMLAGGIGDLAAIGRANLPLKLNEQPATPDRQAARADSLVPVKHGAVGASHGAPAPASPPGGQAATGLPDALVPAAAPHAKPALAAEGALVTTSRPGPKPDTAVEGNHRPAPRPHARPAIAPEGSPVPAGQPNPQPAAATEGQHGAAHRPEATPAEGAKPVSGSAPSEPAAGPSAGNAPSEGDEPSDPLNAAASSFQDQMELINKQQEQMQIVSARMQLEAANRSMMLQAVRDLVKDQKDAMKDIGEAGHKA